ncbi:Regulatory protein AfsR [Aquisphaera giovannonii]|uniref:Regulatory protein AfsR n=1 Tax=Aquisphaera giovannonii TaxID=406548 RepID=A0A5B9WB65_9BACT|nr:Regulatory protein AfsR [Aquisphaera giovannonii]
MYHRPRVFQAPRLPAHYVKRVRKFSEVMAGLLARGSDHPGVLAITAIAGMGGIGKSTLAAALTHDRRVQTRFPDGVLWATLGQEPATSARLGEWLQAMGGEAHKSIDVEELSARLRAIFADKAALLVVDDAWEPEHVTPFLVGGDACRVLITTRRAAVAEEVGSRVFPLDVLSIDESLELLSSYLKRDLRPEEQKDARRMAEAVGRLPLALTLVAARLGRGVSWSDLSDALEAEVGRLGQLENPRQRWKPQPRLIATFNTSLRALSVDVPVAYDAFLWLGVLPEDTTITAAAAATIFGLPEGDADDILEVLWAESLLMPGDAIVQNGRTWRAYRIHDLLHDHAGTLLIAPVAVASERDLPGLGLTMVEAHSRLLGRYRARTRQGQWHTLLNDGYIHSRLTWHFEKSGTSEAIHDLLREETLEGRNGWFEARERLGQVAGYLDDLMRARRLVDDVGFGQRPLLGLQCRYALMAASLNSLASSIPGELLAALVQNKLWVPAQALSLARQIPYPRSRVKALAALAPHLPPSLMIQALEAARAIGDERLRTDALIACALHLPVAERDRALAQALEAARTIKHDWDKSHALVALAPHLSPLLTPQALEAARTIRDEEYRTLAMLALAPHLSGLERDRVLAQALEAARETWNPWRQSGLLIGLAPSLPTPLISQALETARAIGDQRARTSVLVALAPRLPAQERDRVLAQALEAVRTIGDQEARSRYLAVVAPHLSGLERDRVLAQALEAARAIRSPWRQSEVLIGLTPQLPTPLISQALETARAIGDEVARSGALVALAPRLPAQERDRVLAQALEEARAIGDRSAGTRAMAALKPYLPAPERDYLLAQALEAALAIEYEAARSDALVILAPHFLTPEHDRVLAKALEAARAIEYEGDRSRALAALAPHLPPPLVPQALEASLAIRDERERSLAIASLVPHLPPALIPRALEAALAIEYEGARSRALASLVPHLPPPLIPQALEAARAMERDWDRFNTLAALAPHLPPELFSEALATARTIGDEVARSGALVALAPHLPAQERDPALAQALEAARAMIRDRDRFTALAALAPHLPPSLVSDALEATRTIDSDNARSVALAALAQRLPPPLIPWALETARAIENEGDRSRALAALVPHLPPPLIPQALETALAIVEEGSRSRTLAALEPRLLALPIWDLHPLWNTTLEASSMRTRRDLLGDLSILHAVLAKVGGAEAVAETYWAIRNVGRWWP